MEFNIKVTVELRKSMMLIIVLAMAGSAARIVSDVEVVTRKRPSWAGLT